MLGYRPRQEGVNFTTPGADAIKDCKVELVKGQRKGSGWLLRDGSGNALRWFFDTNDDNKIDVWAYYKDGVEVYREIDTTFSGKPDQYRWFNSNGMKWGVDSDRNGKIGYWKAISPEEVSQEVLQAVVHKDYSRLEALLITDNEMKELNLPADMVSKIRELRKNAPAKFQETVKGMHTKQPALATAEVTWIHLETKTPRCLPADQIGTRYDVVKHAGGTIVCSVNVDDKGTSANAGLQTGEIIQVGMAWRLIDAPTPGMNMMEAGEGGILPNNPDLLKRVEELGKLDKTAPPQTSSPDPLVVRHHLKRADLLEQIIAIVDAKEREPWIRQLGDSLCTAAQYSPKSDHAAMTRLLSLEHQLVNKMPGSNLAAYVTFREMQTEYSLKITDNKDFNKVQQDWLDRLSKFVQTYPKAEDTPDAMLQAGMVSEFLDKDTEAKNWYLQLIKHFPDSPQAAKAQGAITRLESEGKPFKLVGPLLQDTTQVFDVDSLHGKVVIVYYWAKWNSQSLGDFAKLKLLLETYGKTKGIELVCINLDNTIEEAKAFLARTPSPGTHLFQKGGLDCNLAASYGVMVLPNVFVIDRQGKMANRKIQINNLEDEIKKQLLK